MNTIPSCSTAWMAEHLVAFSNFRTCSSHAGLPKHFISLFTRIFLKYNINGKKVSKHWKSVVDNEAHWKFRSMKEVSWVGDVEKDFGEQKEKDCSLTWKKYFKKSLWTVHLYEMFSHGGGCDIYSRFSVRVKPNASVEEFLAVLKNCTENPSPHRKQVATLSPFNPNIVGTRNAGVIIPSKPGKPNCKWKVTDEKMSIKEAGLCNGAILAFNTVRIRD